VSYSPIRLSRTKARDSAAIGGEQLRFNNVPIRPLSAIGGGIAFNVAAPFRVSLGLLPKGAAIMGAVVGVPEVFNAGTTNVVTVGTLADPDLLVEAGDVKEAAVGTTLVCHRGGGLLLADTEFFVWYTQTGAAATTGAAIIGLLYGIP